MALGLSRANIKGGTISAWYIQVKADPDKSKWVELKYLRNGKVNFETLSTKDSIGRNRPYAVKMTATAQSLGTATEAAILHILSALVAAEIESAIVLDNGQQINTVLIEPSSTEAGAGFSWKLVSDGDRDETVYIEFRCERIMTLAQVPTILGGTVASSDSEATGTTASGVTSWAQSISDIVPAGFNTLKADSDNSGFEHNFGVIRNGKFEAESLTTTDSLGRNIADGRIKITFEAEMMQASSTETALLDDIAALDAIDWQIAFASGRTITIDDKLGFDYNFEVGSDRDGISFIKVMGEGVVASSAWNALWTA